MLMVPKSAHAHSIKLRMVPKSAVASERVNDSMKRFVQSQREEALSGRGCYRLCPEFSHYGVSSLTWVKMRPEQRRDIVTSFEKAKLPWSPLLLLRMIIRWMMMSVNQIYPLSQLGGLWNNVHSVGYPVCNVGQGFRIAIKRKWNYHSSAVAERNCELMTFLQWYIKSGTTPNISTLALSGLPRGRGQKGGKPKRQRSKITSSAPDNFTLRPGLSIHLRQRCTSAAYSSSFRTTLASECVYYHLSRTRIE